MILNINTIGTSFVIIVALIFYVRIVLLQQNKSGKRLEAYSKNRAKGSNTKKRATGVESAGVRVINWGWMTAAIIVILLGAAVAGLPNLPQNIKDFWWIPVSAGIIMMAFNFK
ncbi:MAG: hypothetical protein LWX83_08705 [Anaerolineae bacterium]|nr:hypothetical protein [Anaerolineae bacterium]